VSHRRPSQLVEGPAVAQDPSPASRPGAAATATWRLRVARAGPGAIKLEYRRPWAREAAAARRFEVGLAAR